MKRPPGMRPAPRRTEPNSVAYDVARVIAERCGVTDPVALTDAAHAAVTVVRERVLQEIGTYTRENVR